MLVLLPMLIKLPLLTGLLVVDPAKRYTGLTVAGDHGWWPGGATIDPNIAYTSHALGSYAVQQVLVGRLPWWNPYEGVGTPLAAEMQAAALFPLTLLLALPNGQLIFHLTLQIIAGLATYGLLREMRIGRSAALAAAVMFEFNGVFAWLANAVVNPIPFLPLMLWGIERLRRSDGIGQRAGVTMIAAGLAASLYAGFPETAYLNALFVLCWALVRLYSASGDRIGLLWRIAMPTAAGLLIAAPILVAFLGYLPHAQVGLHDNSAGHYAHLAPSYLVMIAVPYFMGGIFVTQPDFWGSVGGYSGLLLLVLAGAGLVGREQRALRCMIAGWIIVALALTFGAAWLFAVIKIVPGFKEAAIYRYLPASWLMGLSILAAFGLDDLSQSRIKALTISTGGAVAIVVTLWVLAKPVIGHLPHDPFAWLACFVQLSLLAAFIRFVLIAPTDHLARARVAATLAAAEAMFLFLLPVLAHPRRIEVVDGGIAFMQTHLGQQRFVSFGPIAPNYGSYYGIAQVNHNDLPIPAAWTNFVQRRLDPGMDPILFLLHPVSPPSPHIDQHIPPSACALLSRLSTCRSRAFERPTLTR
ncbi:hypothetical protein [Sphingomonas sp. Leaf339]|uniref:hypothetical protein n=1 Tax=Sphingomonas sp. Leaf339 TaxID=1736343 RepID=UPI000B06073C|nr:hypothetical protein [Sphingomonas sp. Leaf339]